MEPTKKAGFPIVGALFLAVAVLQFLQGDNWVVWVILSVLFGSLSLFRARKRSDV